MTSTPASGAAATTVADLLSIDDVDSVVNPLLARSLLDDGRVEAQTFGRNEHSTASAGALLIGLAGMPEISDATIAPLVDRGLTMISAGGAVRGHDLDSRTGSTSWSAAQLLLGLVTRPALVKRHRPRVKVLANYLLSFQDAGSGGWPFRFDESSSSVFAFYPSLALARTFRIGLVRRAVIDQPLAQLIRFHRSQLEMTTLPLEERLLSLTALEVLISSSRFPVPSGFLAGLRDAAADDGYDASTHTLRLADRTVVANEQPMWHATLWAPLFYMCLRRWAPPMHPTAALLAERLLSGFDAGTLAWEGPSNAPPAARVGVSWATALALRTTGQLARDLSANAMTVDDLKERIRMVSGGYDYDVVISFGGPDRTVAREISRRLKAAGLRVFYDRDEQHRLLGEDLAQMLQTIYLERSRYAVVVLSNSFVNSTWAGNWEWKAVLARMQRQRRGYVLPYYLEKVDIPGLNPTIGYLSAPEHTVRDFCDVVVRKLRSAP